MKKILNKFYRKNSFIVISFCIIIILLITSFFLQGILFGFNQIFVQALLPNIITSLVDLIITAFILKLIFDKQEIKKNKMIIHEIKNSYIGFLDFISYRLIVFITANSSIKINGKKQNYSEVLGMTLGAIDTYVQDDICLKTFNVFTVLDASQNPVFENITYEQYLYNFKLQVRQQINSFLSSYQLILPNEIISSITKIIDLLNDNMLVTPSYYGIKVDYSKVKFSGKDLRTVLSQIGNELMFLYEYAKE